MYVYKRQVYGNSLTCKGELNTLESDTNIRYLVLWWLSFSDLDPVYTRTDPNGYRSNLKSCPNLLAFTLERIQSQVQPRFQHFDPNLITKRREIYLAFDWYPLGNLLL